MISASMSVFIGGSAFAMARDITEGYIIVSEHTFKKFHTADLAALQFEFEKLIRELRAEVVPADEVEAVQKKNRKLQRLQQAITMMSNFRQKSKR